MDIISIAEFLEYIPKKSTQAMYLTALKRYLSLTLGIKTDTANIEHAWRQYLLSGRDIDRDVIMFPHICNSRTPPLSPKTINAYQRVVLMYLKECGYSAEQSTLRKIKKNRPHDFAITRESEITREDIARLTALAPVRQRAEILLAVSSGMRIGEILQIRCADLDLDKSPAEVYLPYWITKTGVARTVFMSDEACGAVRSWLAVRDEMAERGRVSLSDERVFPFTIANEILHLNKLLAAAGSLSVDAATRRATIHFHLFRKFFLTEFKLAASAEVAEELAGHKGYLSSSYRRLSLSVMRQEYRKAEPRLTMCGGEVSFVSAGGADVPLCLQKLSAEILQLRSDIAELRLLCQSFSP